MASMDHTARAHLLVRDESFSESTQSVEGSPQFLGEAPERSRTVESCRAGIGLAIAVIEGMLKTHRRYELAHPEGEKSGLLPLNPVQLVGLEGAIDLLYRYLGTLIPQEVSG
jgi:hypothetical protein